MVVAIAQNMQRSDETLILHHINICYMAAFVIPGKNEADLRDIKADGLYQPLPERLRPRHLSEVVGQQHVLGEGMPLRLAFESGRPTAASSGARRAWARPRLRASWLMPLMRSF